MWSARTVAPKKLSAYCQRLLLARAPRPVRGVLLERGRLRPVRSIQIEIVCELSMLLADSPPPFSELPSGDTATAQNGERNRA